MKHFEAYFFLALAVIFIIYNLILIAGLILNKAKPWPQFGETKISKIAYCIIAIGCFIFIAYFKIQPILSLP